MMRKTLHALALLTIALVAQRTSGAEMSVAKDDVGQLVLQVMGPIDDGDDAKFRSMLVAAINHQQQIINVSTYSPGGQAMAAMKIGRYIRILRLTTVAPEALPLLRLRICRTYANSRVTAIDYNPLTGRGDPRCTCAGECFLMWAAGSARIWSGVELRRIALPSDETPRAPTEDAGAGDRSTVADYLRDMGIPEGTIQRVLALEPGQWGYLTAEERNLLETKTGFPRPDEPFYSRCRDKTPTSPAALACEKAVSRELYWVGAKELLNQNE